MTELLIKRFRRLRMFLQRTKIKPHTRMRKSHQPWMIKQHGSTNSYHVRFLFWSSCSPYAFGLCLHLIGIVGKQADQSREPTTLPWKLISSHSVREASERL